MAHFHNNALIGASGQGGYLINQSLRFNSADSTNLTRNISTTGNRRTFTISFWFKSVVSNSDGGFVTTDGNILASNYIEFELNGNNKLQFRYSTGNARSTTAVFRDPSAWYHIVFAVDTTQATDTNRIRVYVNGIEYATTGDAYPAQNFDTNFNTAGVAAQIGYSRDNSGNPAKYLSGYIAEYNHIDGQQLTPSSFGETDTITGAWIPKKYSGSYGTNGFYLKFESSGIGTDSSGNGNNWTANNFSTSGTGTDVMSDTPTNNWCTFNPAYASQNNSGNQFSEGNLTYVSSGAAWRTNVPTFGSISSGKWYWEWSVNTVNAYIGVIGEDVNTVTSGNTQSQAGTILYYSGDGNKRIDNVASSYGSAYNGGGSGWSPTVGVALDKDNNTITFYRNNVSQGTINLSSSSVDLVNKPVRPAFLIYDGTSYGNFGQFAFQYTPPTGFKALNTANLPEPTIKKGGAHFNTVLWTGNGGVQSVSGVGFQPDMTWVKSRSLSAEHWINDAVRGAGYSLPPSNTLSEQDYRVLFTSFNSDGFSLDQGTSSFNQTSATYVGWNWKANGAGSSNTAGSITSTVSANASAGFSIVTYTGTGSNASVGHGLGVTPSMCIIKQRNTAQNWWVWHQALGNNVGANNTMLELNGTAGTYPADDVFRGFTSTLFQIGTDSGSNTNGGTYVAYCFSEVAGYSKFGSYTGNGIADGPFVYCGFRPRWIMIKNATLSGGNWRLIDTARETYNVGWMDLYANSSTAETAHSAGTTNQIDILSNGFKLRDQYNETNRSGDTLVFAAFAELPFKYANAR